MNAGDHGNDQGRQPGKARGVLRRAQQPEGLFHHLRRAAPIDLQPFVEHFWMVDWDLRGRAPQNAETLPHPSVHVVLERDASRVAGVFRTLFQRTLAEKGRVFGIKFLPGGFYPFVRSPLSRITDRVLTLPALFGEGSDELEALVLSHDESDAMIDAASRWLRARMPERDPVAEQAGAFVGRILSDPEIGNVEDLAERVGTSLRQLQRMFNRYIGVSPKWVIQRYRLHEALARIEDGAAADWPQLALDLGYVDQAHFIRAFKALIGRTPGQYAKELGAVTVPEPAEA